MNFGLLIFLPPFPEFWNYSPASSQLVYAVFKVGGFLLGKRSISWATPPALAKDLGPVFH